MNQSIERLTSAELKVLELIVEHYTNAEIADVLVCSTETIKTHVHHILQKLDARSRRDAARAYLANIPREG
ncbi:MAG TPA: helix-turn-helix transcriptional regulator [Tepidiformaceae bacterium]|nr:helix-turn-helix transcriptional regulator [Tepidiformaceae bacterium]